jgi:hypothetical protein
MALAFMPRVGLGSLVASGRRTIISIVPLRDWLIEGEPT